MGSFVMCPERGKRKVDLQICILKCSVKGECKELQEIPRKDLHATMRRLNIPVPVDETLYDAQVAPVDSGPTIEVEAVVLEAEEMPQEPSKAPVKNPVTVMKRHPTRGGKAEILYRQILALSSEIGARWFELGKVLQEFFEGKYYRDIGYETWKGFCATELDPLNIKWRTADYLRITRMKCDEVGIGKEVAGEIGWSRLKEITPVVTKENKDQWVNLAKKKGMTTEKLNARVRVARGKITEEEAEKVPEKVFFSLYEEQLENVERALELAQRMTGSESKGNALDMVCAEFRATYEVSDGEHTKARIVMGLIERIEATMGVKVGVSEIVDANTGEIV